MIVVPRAERELKKLPADVQRRIAPILLDLGANPRPHGLKALKGSRTGLLRVRVGEYRVIFAVDDQARAVYVEGFGHRGDVYR